MNSTETQMHPIKIVSRRTGLSTHVIRVWERRYNAISPERTDTNRRLYSDEDIQRLNLLKRATLTGRSIGQIANLATPALIELVGQDQQNMINRPLERTGLSDEKSPEEFVKLCMEAIESMDFHALEKTLEIASIPLSQPILLEHVIIPLLIKIGEGWKSGTLRIAHEHMYSAVLRTFLGNQLAAYRNPDNAPSIILSTPSGQMHEFGALLVGIVAASEGWRVIYLGSNLPIEEIIHAARASKAQAVALSITYPADEARTIADIKKLGTFLPSEVALLFGGRAAALYQDAIASVTGTIHDDLNGIRETLEHVRAQGLTSQ